MNTEANRKQEVLKRRKIIISSLQYGYLGFSKFVDCTDTDTDTDVYSAPPLGIWIMAATSYTIQVVRIIHR